MFQKEEKLTKPSSMRPKNEKRAQTIAIQMLQEIQKDSKFGKRVEKGRQDQKWLFDPRLCTTIAKQMFPKPFVFQCLCAGVGQTAISGPGAPVTTLF